MNMPTLETQRLILRRFTEQDLEAIYKIYSDVEINRFLPWFPLKTVEEAERLYRRQFESQYAQEFSCNYAITLKKQGDPVGYVHVSAEESHDLGYALRREFWHKGIVTEACRAVLERLKQEGVPYVTATHDVNNPRSGNVMKRLGMCYQYSYQEQWMPKNIPVIFRMYQINLDGEKNRIYRSYWNSSTIHFVETEV